MTQGGFALTPRVLELGMAYIGSTSIWLIARPHMEQLVGHPDESSSLAQLDGSDIVYVSRVAVPIGTRFPAFQTSLGEVLLTVLPLDELERVLDEPRRSGITALWQPKAEERDQVLYEVRTRGWALTDEHLAHSIRSIAAPVRDAANHMVAALNVTVHVAETSIEILTEKYLPLLLQTAAAISTDWTRRHYRPQITLGARSAITSPKI